MDQWIEALDTDTIYHIKGDVIWALGPKVKHEIMRGQWGIELKDVNLPDLLKLIKKTFIPTRNGSHGRAHVFNVKEEENETPDEYWKRLVDIEKNASSAGSHPKKLSHTNSSPQLTKKKPETFLSRDN